MKHIVNVKISKSQAEFIHNSLATVPGGLDRLVQQIYQLALIHLHTKIECLKYALGILCSVKLYPDEDTLISLATFEISDEVYNALQEFQVVANANTQKKVRAEWYLSCIMGEVVSRMCDRAHYEDTDFQTAVYQELTSVSLAEQDGRQVLVPAFERALNALKSGEIKTTIVQQRKDYLLGLAEARVVDEQDRKAFQRLKDTFDETFGESVSFDSKTVLAICDKLKEFRESEEPSDGKG